MVSKDVKKAIKGYKDKLANCILEIQNSLYRVSYGILNNEEDAKDAISNTIIKVYENISSLKNAEFFKTWITRILINECNNIIRKNSKYVECEEIEKVKTDEINILSIAVRDIINKLGNDFKNIVILYYFDDYSVKEISKILDISTGTVKSRLSRARDELKRLNIKNLKD